MVTFYFSCSFEETARNKDSLTSIMDIRNSRGLPGETNFPEKSNLHAFEEIDVTNLLLNVEAPVAPTQTAAPRYGLFDRGNPFTTFRDCVLSLQEKYTKRLMIPVDDKADNLKATDAKHAMAESSQSLNSEILELHEVLESILSHERTCFWRFIMQ